MRREELMMEKEQMAWDKAFNRAKEKEMKTKEKKGATDEKLCCN